MKPWHMENVSDDHHKQGQVWWLSLDNGSFCESDVVWPESVETKEGI